MTNHPVSNSKMIKEDISNSGSIAPMMTKDLIINSKLKDGQE